MLEPTPQEQAENMMAGIKNAYRVVAKRHIHPWYSWALMAMAIGFTVGVAYVANERGSFDASQAATSRVSNTNSFSKNANREKEAQTALITYLLNEYAETHGGRQPEQIGVSVASLKTIPGKVKTLAVLSPMKLIPFSTPTEKTAAKSYLASLKSPYDLFLGPNPTLDENKGNLLFPGNTIANTGFAEIVVKTNGVLDPSSGMTVTVTKNLCKCSTGQVKVSYNGSSVTTSISGKTPIECDSAANKSFCNEICEGMAIGVATPLLAGNAPKTYKGVNPIEDAMKGGDSNTSLPKEVQEYLAKIKDIFENAETTFDDIGNRSVCAENKVATATVAQK